MKLWNLFGFGVITLALATGCNKHPENLNGPEIEDDGEPLYVSNRRNRYRTRASL